MKITVLFASPNEGGSTAILTEAFKRGATEAGHTVSVIDITKKNIAPCIGCVSCGYEGPCVQKDDMQGVKNELLSSEMIVFATPLYYYGMSAQLKTVVDRFCSFNGSLTRKRMKSALLSVAWNADDWTFTALSAHYNTLVRYLKLQDQGQILGYGCGTPSMTQSSLYPQKAYELGKSLR